MILRIPFIKLKSFINKNKNKRNPHLILRIPLRNAETDPFIYNLLHYNGLRPVVLCMP